MKQFIIIFLTFISISVLASDLFQKLPRGFNLSPAPIIAAPSSEFYRQKLPLERSAGADQGNVGSCQAEAEIAALESAFYEKGYAVRLSSFYQHARIFQKRIEVEAVAEKKAKIANDGMLRFNSEDFALLNRMGDVVPYYMLPDDTTGYRPYDSGLRPHITKMMAPDANFKPLSLSRREFTFLPGYSNSGTTAQLKTLVKAGYALTLDYDPDFLMTGITGIYFDERTGLFLKGAKLNDAPYDTPTHASAIVGYDDSLYSDYGFKTPGAFIIKNSWNSTSRRLTALAHEKPDDETLAGLKSMRYKLSGGQNLPGYYAIPYEFISMALSRKKNIGYTILDLNYDAFAAQYFKLAADYKVIIAPYICGAPFPKLNPETSGAKKMILEYGKYYFNILNRTSPEFDDVEYKKLAKLLEIQLSPREGKYGLKQFKYAYFSIHEKSGVDRVRDFYSGVYNDYYCFAGQGEEFNQPEYLYPHLGFYISAQFRNSLSLLSIDNQSSANWADFLKTLFNKEYQDEKNK